MLSPAILNRSMPRTPIPDMGCPPLPRHSIRLQRISTVLKNYTRWQALWETVPYSCPNLQFQFQSLRLICPNLEVIYHYAHVLENIAALTASDAYLGSC